MTNKRRAGESTAPNPVEGSTSGRRLALVPRTGTPWLASVPPHSFPAALPPFVGRTQAIDELADAVAKHRLVTLTGPSGIGKTRLAIEVATQIHPWYPNGVWLVELAPIRNPDLVPVAVASALGIDPEPGRDPTDAVVAHVGTGVSLLVLDNCEHVLSACATLLRRLLVQCRGLRVIATSQQQLGVLGECGVPVVPLSVPARGSDGTGRGVLESEAVQLFCLRAAAEGSFRLTDDSLPAVAEICERLDGIPLAIELAAARVSVLGPADIAERLERRFRLLTGGDRRGDPRHQTLQAAIDWSYDLLEMTEATLLRRLSVFAGGASLPAVEEVCAGDGVGRDDVVDLLTSLVSKSLVEADTSRPRARYRLLQTIRAYGWSRLEEHGELASIQARHAAWCVSLVEQAWNQVGTHDRQYWENLLEADHDNIRVALEWAVANEPQLALRLAAALALFWKSRGYLREGQDWLARALEACRDAPAGLRARGLHGLALLALMRSEVEVARRAAEQSLALAREGQLPRAEAHALNLLGFISIFSQNPLQAKPVIEEVVARARAEGDAGALASSLALLGRVHLFLGEIQAAQEVFEMSLQVAKASDDDLAEALVGLGRTALAAGRLAPARELFERALVIRRDEKDRFETALILSFLGELAWAQGELGTATGMLEESIALARVMGAPFPLSRSLATLARVANFQGDQPSAARLADEACRVAQDAQLAHAFVRALHVRGDVLRASGDVDGAAGAYQQALTAARPNGDAVGEGASLRRSARLALSRGVDDEAAALVSDALRVQADTGAAALIDSLETMAAVATQNARTGMAAGLFGAAQALRNELGYARAPDDVADYENDLAALRSRLADGELEAALAKGGQLSREEAVALALRGRGRRDRDVRGWASLSPTERQIVDLVADGLTNKEIGERLFISPRTVQGHLTRIFGKLDVGSRRELRDARRQR